MAQVLTPPASPGAGKLHKEAQKDNSSAETLDALLERYLYLLDRHQKLQEELGKQLASVRLFLLTFYILSPLSNTTLT